MEQCSSLAEADATRPALSGALMAPLRSTGINRWLRPAICIAAGVLISIAVTTTGPLRSAIQIGGDERYEVSKALLWMKGVPLYKAVWNDQPPLHTALLTVAFKCFGATI